MSYLDNLKSCLKMSKKYYNSGLVFALEGVEATGKTSTSKYLNDILNNQNIKSCLVADFYEYTDRSGPLIAAITENPCILLEDNLSLFLLYCARLSEKVFLASRLSLEYDIVILDRIDTTLYSRAVYGWGLNKYFVDETLNFICKDLKLKPFKLLIQCLDANDNIREKRFKNKNRFRRRYLVKTEAFATIRQGFLDYSKKK